MHATNYNQPKTNNIQHIFLHKYYDKCVAISIGSLIRVQSIVFTSLVTDGQTNGQVENITSRPAVCPDELETHEFPHLVKLLLYSVPPPKKKNCILLIFFAFLQ